VTREGSRGGCTTTCILNVGPTHAHMAACRGIKPKAGRRSLVKTRKNATPPCAITPLGTYRKLWYLFRCGQESISLIRILLFQKQKTNTRLWVRVTLMYGCEHNTTGSRPMAAPCWKIHSLPLGRKVTRASTRGGHFSSATHAVSTHRTGRPLPMSKRLLLAGSSPHAQPCTSSSLPSTSRVMRGAFQP